MWIRKKKTQKTQLQRPGQKYWYDNSNQHEGKKITHGGIKASY
jgi:hypothetical protein